MTRFGLVIFFLVACGGPGRAPATPPAPVASAAPAGDPVAPAGNPAAPAGNPAAPAGNPAAPAEEATVGAGSGEAGAAAGAAAAEEDETQILEVEAIGPLQFGSRGTDLVKHLGAPKTKSPGSYEGATGGYVSWWSWPGVGATMVAGKPTGPWLARSIQVSAPSKLATKAGIRIGSSRKEVEAKYQRGSMDQGEPESFLAGSPYGGMYFTFKDGVVTEIGLGVFAF